MNDELFQLQNLGVDLTTAQQLVATGFLIIDIPQTRCADCGAQYHCIELQLDGDTVDCNAVQSAVADTQINRAYLL